jgi:hypothetical protein
VEHRMSRRHRLAVLVTALALALAVLMAGAWLRTPGRPGAPAPAHLQPRSPVESEPALERAEDGPKQCVGPHPVEGPFC